MVTRFKHSWGRLAMLLVVALLIAAIAAACSGNKGETPAPSTTSNTGNEQQSATPEPQEKPFKLSMLNVYHKPDPPAKDNVILAEIEKLTNTEIEMQWVPDAAYKDKINITLASSTMPSILVVQENRLAPIINASRAGVFWELGPYLNEFPNLSKLNPDLLRATSVDGKVYGIYRARDLSRGGLIYREDWLENVGLSEPKSIEDYAKVLEAFTTQDPDRNGKNDTVGLSLSKDVLGNYKNLRIWFGAANGWRLNNGKFIKDFTEPEYLEMLTFLRDMYAKGYINTDFPVVQDAKEPFVNGKSGTVLYCMCDVPGGSFDDLQKNNPSAKMNFTNLLEGPEGRVTGADAGYNGLFMIPKQSVTTEDELRKVLAFLDKLASDEARDLLARGIEGVHYTMKNGDMVRDMDLFNKEVEPFIQFTIFKLPVYGANDNPLNKKYQDLLAENENIAVYNPSAGLISDTDAEKGSQLFNLLNDAVVKYITGSIDVNGWNDMIAQWRATGGDQVAKEFEEANAMFEQ